MFLVPLVIANKKLVSRPHSQFLIQSVRTDHATLFEEYNEELVKSATFGQSTLTFVSTAQSPHEYMQSQEAEAKHGFAQSRQFVQALEFSTRKDDVRTALEVREIWESSIVKEIKELVEVVERQRAAATEHEEDVDAILTNERTDLHEHLPKEGGKFRKSFQDEKLSSVKSAKAPFGGSEQNSKETWADQKQHYEASSVALKEIQEMLKLKLEESSKLFVDHVTSVVSDSDYQLKWPTDFATEPLSSESPILASEAIASLLSSKQVQEFQSFQEEGGDKVGSGESGNGANSGNVDSFAVSVAAEDAVSLIAAIREGGHVSLGGHESPSRNLSQLIDGLTVLQVRRLGLIDARASIMKLAASVQTQMANLAEQIRTSVTSIGTRLSEKEESLVYTYRDAISFDGVVLDSNIGDKGPATDTFQKHLDELNAAYQSGDSHASLIPRISFIVNSARALHRQLLSFVAAHTQTVPGSEVSAKVAASTFEAKLASQFAAVTTSILETPATVASWIAAPGEGEGVVEAEKVTSEKLAQQEERARITALCMLYGRIDGLEEHRVHQEGAQEDALCGASFAFGEALTVEIGEAYPSAERETNEQSKPLSK